MCKIADVIIFLMLGLCSISDWKKKTIPLKWILIMGVTVLILAFLCKDMEPGQRIGGGMVGIIFLFLSKCTKEAIGYGDSLLIFILGIHLGGLCLLRVLFLASVIAAIASLFRLWKHGWKRNATLPFVPFLSIAYLGEMML